MSRNASRKVNWTRFIPGLQMLEARENPVGNITANVVNGVLIVRGTDDVDSFKFSGTGEDSGVLTPLNGGTLNGGSRGIYFGGVHGLDIRTFGDTDQVILENANISEFISVDTGDGFDVVHVVAGTRSQGSTWIKAGAGDDKVFLTDARFSNHFHLDGGSGNDRVEIQRSRFDGRVTLDGSTDAHDVLGIVATAFLDGRTTVNFESKLGTALPVGVDDTASVSGNGSTTINVLANDVARQGTVDTTTVQINRQPTFGTAKVNTDGTITYTRTADGNGSDFLQYVFKSSLGTFSNETFVRIALSGSVDTSAPSVTLSLDGTPNPTNTTPVKYTAVFNESVTGFTKTNLSIVNGTASDISGSGSTYTFTVTPTGQGTVSATILANAAKDAAGNSSTASGTVSTVFDTTAPTVAGTALTTNDTTPQIAGTVEAGSTVTVVISGNSITAQTLTGTVSGTNWTADVTTALAEGTYDFTVTAKDAAGNTATDTKTGGLVVDTTPPAGTLDSTASSPTTTSPIPFTVSFNESVTTFTIEDLQIGNGTATNFSGSGKNYTFSITPTGNGDVTAQIKADGVTDAAGNKNAASAVVTRTFTGGNPSVTITSATADPTNKTSIPVTVTFSTAVTGFDETDLTLTNATVTGFAGSGATYTFNLVPANQGTTGVTISANKAVDATNAGNLASNSFTRIFDSKSTSGTVNNLTTNDTTPTITGTVFDPTNVTVTVTVAGQTKVATVTGNTWSAELGTALVDNRYDVSVVFSDTAGNSTPLFAPQVLQILTTQPTVSITSAEPNPTKSSPILLAASFDRAVTGFVLGDITVTGGTVTKLTDEGDSTNFSVEVTPTGDGTVTVSIAAGKAQDEAGNNNTASNTFTIVSDATAPTVTITSTATNPTATSPVPFTIDFSEVVTGFDQSDLVVTGGTIGGFSAVAKGKQFIFTVATTAQGPITVNIPAGAATDAVGNSSKAAAEIIRNVDFVPAATLTAATAGPTKAASVTYTVDFGEAMTGFELADITVTKGAASNLQTSDNKVFTFDVAPASDGTVAVSIPANAALDSGSNGNTASAVVSFVSDRTGPVGVIAATDSSPSSKSPLTFTVTFDEAVADFDSGDLTIAGGTFSKLTANSSTLYTVEIVPTADGDVTLSLAAGVASDALGNTNAAVAGVTVVSDRTAPVPLISANVTSPTNGSSYVVTIAFGEEVTGFTQADVGFANGAITNFGTANGGKTYTFTFTPSQDGANTFSIAAGVAFDLAGNATFAAADFSVTTDRLAPTGTIAADAVSGTATDATTSVATVEVSIFDGTSGKYWDGTAFTGATEIFLAATGTTAWSYVFTTAGTYTVNARFTDIVGNTSTISQSVVIP